MSQKPGTHCKVCGNSFADAGRYYRELLCTPCGTEKNRERSKFRCHQDSIGQPVRPYSLLIRKTKYGDVLERRIQENMRRAEQELPMATGDVFLGE